MFYIFYILTQNSTRKSIIYIFYACNVETENLRVNVAHPWKVCAYFYNFEFSMNNKREFVFDKFGDCIALERN